MVYMDWYSKEKENNFTESVWGGNTTLGAEVYWEVVSPVEMSTNELRWREPVTGISVELEKRIRNKLKDIIRL